MDEEEELVIASSSVDAGIGCWDLQTGAEHLRYKSCASSPHGLTCVGRRFLASAQLRESSGSIFYWSWSKSQVEVKSFVEEPILPLVANSEGTYIAGGGSKGNIYLWEVATGRLLKKWQAHWTAVTCLAFNDDDSLLVSGSVERLVKVWSLFKIFDDYQNQQASHLYEHSFSGHTERVNDVVTGHGGGNAIIISASDDHTCKVWSLSRGKLLRSIAFPSKIFAIALVPDEHIFYAGGEDGQIHIAALNSDSSSGKSRWMHIINSLSRDSIPKSPITAGQKRKSPITCLAYSTNGNLLLVGFKDGKIQVWDLKMEHMVREFEHAKGPVNNIYIVRRPCYINPRVSSNMQASSKRRRSLPPPLHKYVNSDGNTGINVVINPRAACNNPLDASYVSSQVIDNQIKELQQHGSSSASEMEVERLKLDCTQSMQMLLKWKKMYDSLHEFCVNEVLEGDNTVSSSQT